jgi:hypothetical protein
MPLQMVVRLAKLKLFHFLKVTHPEDRSRAIPDFAADAAEEQMVRRLVWGFSCQAVVLGCAEVFCSERERPFFVPSPAIRFPERAEGVKGPKR